MKELFKTIIRDWQKAKIVRALLDDNKSSEGAKLEENKNPSENKPEHALSARSALLPPP